MRVALSVLVCFGLSSVAAGCAQDVPGVEPPLDQLHFPFGMSFVRGADPSLDRLLIANSDFDQRFNAGSIFALSVDRIFDRVAALEGAGARTEAALPVESSIRIDPFGGELLVVPGPEGESRLFIAARGRNRLTMLRMNARGDLSCTSGGTSALPGIDCSLGHVVGTGGPDPFALALLPEPDTEGGGLVAVGHLSTIEEVGNIALAEIGGFEARVAAEEIGGPLLSPIQNQRLGTTPRISGLAAYPASAPEIGELGRLLVAGSGEGSVVEVLAEPAPGGVVVRPIFGGASIIEFSVHRVPGQPTVSLRLRGLRQGFGGLGTTGLERVGERAYLSMRFDEQPFADERSSPRFNSAIAVIDLGAPGLTMISILEVGEEIGRPAVLVRSAPGPSRLIYVPDLRTDAIWVIDASTDALALVGKVEGRGAPRVGQDEPRIKLLDTPSAIVFVERGDRTLGFVTNFANSTLAVIDVSAPDPRLHQLVARFGRALNPDGTEEGE